METPSVEQIKNQEHLIEKEIADKIPFISERIPIQTLKQDYQPDDEIYQSKISNLEKSYESLRRTRPDGNCFYRAFGFAYFESLLADQNHDELDRFIELTNKSKQDLIKLGLPAVTIEDFFEIFLEVLMNIKDGTIQTPAQLLEKFCEQTISDYVVVYFRLLTSGYLQHNADKFASFIVGSSSIIDFCKTEVEPMYKESDHIHVVAITSALQIHTRIVYMDRGSSSADGSLNAHDFPEQLDQSELCRVHLLYRPGHYDVLYPIS